MKSLILPLLLLLTSCLPEESTPTSSSLYVAAGDILVSSGATDTVLQFDSNGVYKKIFWRTALATEVVYSVKWSPTSNEVLITVDGSPDRVVAVSVIDGRERNLVNNANIGGNIRVGTQLEGSRDLLISELTSVERASQDGLRETYTGVWPHTTAATMTNVVDIAPKANGDFVIASSSQGIRSFVDSTTVAMAIDNSLVAPAGTTGSYGIHELENGQFLVSWEGAGTDYLSIHNADLTLDQHIINNNQGLLASPRGVAVTRDGNYLVADFTLDYVIEMTPSGSLVQRIGLGLIDAPYGILVVPDFSP